MTFGEPPAVIPGMHRRPSSRPCPLCARTARHRCSMCPMIHSMESPWFSAVGAGNKMLFWWLNIGINYSSLVSTCTWTREAAGRVNMSMELRAHFGVCVGAVAWKQASYIIKSFNYSEDPGHRHPIFPTDPSFQDSHLTIYTLSIFRNGPWVRKLEHCNQIPQ